MEGRDFLGRGEVSGEQDPLNGFEGRKHEQACVVSCGKANRERGWNHFKIMDDLGIQKPIKIS